MTLLTPHWPSRAERLAAIEAAIAERKRSQTALEQTRKKEQAIWATVAQNNWAEHIADAIGIPHRGTGEGNGE